MTRRPHDLAALLLVVPMLEAQPFPVPVLSLSPWSRAGTVDQLREGERELAVHVLLQSGFRLRSLLRLWLTAYGPSRRRSPRRISRKSSSRGRRSIVLDVPAARLLSRRSSMPRATGRSSDAVPREEEPDAFPPQLDTAIREPAEPKRPAAARRNRRSRRRRKSATPPPPPQPDRLLPRQPPNPDPRQESVGIRSGQGGVRAGRVWPRRRALSSGSPTSLPLAAARTSIWPRRTWRWETIDAPLMSASRPAPATGLDAAGVPTDRPVRRQCGRLRGPATTA